MAPAIGKARPKLQQPPQVRSLPVDQWPSMDRDAWTKAGRPHQRLIRGGAGAHMKPGTLNDLARRYGYFLDFMVRSGLFDRRAAPASLVTPDTVDQYIKEIQKRVGSVTVYGSIYKLRRAGQLLDPTRDFGWLIELEKDLALIMRPRSKANRLLLSDVLVESGLTLIQEAECAATLSSLAKARQFRNGLMVAMLALHPIRLKNFASLEIGRNFKNIDDWWWIVLSASETKEARPDERRIDEPIAVALRTYLRQYRPVLARQDGQSGALWLSSNDGQPMSYHAVADAVTRSVCETTGVPVSPHMFRTSAASSAAIHAAKFPHLGSALLHHRDRRVTEENYNYASTLSAAKAFRKLIKEL